MEDILYRIKHLLIHLALQAKIWSQMKIVSSSTHLSRNAINSNTISPSYVRGGTG
jgi:hypothetical protein